MLKVKIPKIGLMILTSVFCLFLSGVAAEKECWDSLGGGPTFTGNHTYTPDWYPEFQYDPNNPDEIDRNSSVGISVIGGFPPYTWQVSGNGFSLSLNETEGLSNALYANDTACGTATIEVTDKYGTHVTGYVRCSEGEWSAVVGWSTGGTPHACGPGEVTKYIGSLKIQYLCTSNFTNNCIKDWIVTAPISGQSVALNGSDCGDACYWHPGYPAGWYCSGCCNLWSGGVWEWTCKE